MQCVCVDVSCCKPLLLLAQVEKRDEDSSLMQLKEEVCVCVCVKCVHVWVF